MVSRSDADAMATALMTAATASTVRQYRYTLRAQAKEWQRAIRDFDMAEGEGEFELAGALVPSMWIVFPNVDYPEDGLWRQVIRKTNTAGLSFEIEDPSSPRAAYRSFAGPMSPVVVKK